MTRHHQSEPHPLADELAQLRDEVRVLRIAVDELTEAVTWQNNNAEDYPALMEGRSRLWSLAHVTLPKLLTDIQFPPVQEAETDAPPLAGPVTQAKLF